MDEERPRRMAVLVLLCGVFLVTSWMEDFRLTLEGTVTPARGKVSVRKAGSPLEDGRRETRGGKKGDYISVQEEEEDDDDKPEYMKGFKAKSHPYLRTSAFQLDLYSCLPRFICELHAQAPGAALTDFEKDVLRLFRNHVVLEGPGSPSYPYQVAAHMGQLWVGVEPSPCHSLYPSCPISRALLLKLLGSIKTSRRMFY